MLYSKPSNKYGLSKRSAVRLSHSVAIQESRVKRMTSTLLSRRAFYQSARRMSFAWTINAAIDETVPAHVLTAALYERFSSRGEADFADKLLSALRYEFGGHLEKSAT